MLDPYEILGVSRDATFVEIRRAYRKLALIHHPDKSKDSGAFFRELKDAFEFLKNPEKRQKLDKQFKPGKERRGSDLRVSINVRFEEMINEHKKRVVIQRNGLCQSCDGTGSEKKRVKKCIYCNGTGLQGLSLVLGEKKKCPYCVGEGVIPEGNKCLKCKGTSLIQEIKQHDIILNPLSSIVLRGEGNFSPFQGKAGNLIIDLIRREEEGYQIDGLNVTNSVKITPAQAVLGDVLHLTVFSKEISVKIPPGIQHNAVLKQPGFTYKKEIGVFKTVVNVEIPQIISERQRELYQKMLDLEKESLLEYLFF